jgi:hypothetical protein
VREILANAGPPRERFGRGRFDVGRARDVAHFVKDELDDRFGEFVRIGVLSPQKARGIA